MPSLRKKVSTYLRQLSFYNETREKRDNNNIINENAFVIKYLQGQIALKEGPRIVHGKTPNDLPNYDVGLYETGAETIVGCLTGPDEGLTTVHRAEKHLSVPDTDIDFIDTQEETEGGREAILRLSAPSSPHVAPPTPTNRTVDNSTMVIRCAGQEYHVTNRHRPAKAHSLDRLPPDVATAAAATVVQVERTRKMAATAEPNNNNNHAHVPCRNAKPADEPPKPQRSTAESRQPGARVKRVQLRMAHDSVRERRRAEDNRRSRGDGQAVAVAPSMLAKSKSDGNPFQQHRRRGKLVQVALRSAPTQGGAASASTWNRHSDYVYGISDSLYDRNQVTQVKNGDPIADCFGVIARQDSAILAVADGVNWGERASIAAKAAAHGCLHYLNQTLFGDSSPFDTPASTPPPRSPAHRRVTATRDVFVALLRAFSCAHDLILENDGMLTTLTVAVVLPLRPRIVRSPRDGATARDADTDDANYVCCVCNVGDTLAYVYSQRYGIREITKGSHDVSCNRDMRDALGALGPVDGINPELSNLTLSLTTLRRGDIIMIASDGLTDNFDPNVCRFTVSAKDSFKRKATPVAGASQPVKERQQHAPQKPPRRSKKSPDTPTADNVAKMADAPKMAEPPKIMVEAPKMVGEEETNPLVAHFLRENSLDESKTRETVASGGGKSTVKGEPVVHVHPTAVRHIPPRHGHGFFRSKTSIDMRSGSKQRAQLLLRDDAGIPLATPTQRYELCLLLMEDVLVRGLNGCEERGCAVARALCDHLVRFAFGVTAAKRHALEDADLYFDSANGVRVEVSQQEKKTRRRHCLDRLQALPGKLDHVTVVAYNVGCYAETA